MIEKKFAILIILLSFFTISWACNKSSFDINSITENSDGTVTYNITINMEWGGLDGYNYGFALGFLSESETIVVNNSSPSVFRNRFDDGELRTHTGDEIGSSTSDFKDYYGTRTDILTFEHNGQYYYDTEDYSLTFDVTLTGCVERIIFFGDYENTAEDYSCTYQLATGNDCSPDPCPAANTSMSECSGVFDLNSLEQTITGSTVYDLSWPVANPDAHNGTDGEQVTVTVTGADCEENTATVSLSIPNGPLVINGTVRECGSGSAVFDLTQVETIIAPLDYANAKYTWYEDANLNTQISNPSAFSSSPSTVYAEIEVDGCTGISEVKLELEAMNVSPASLTNCSSGSTATFDLTSVESTITNNDNALTVEWYTNSSATQSVSNANAFTSGQGVVYAKVADDAGCETIMEVPLNVGAVEANDQDISVCGSGNEATIDLTDYETDINASVGAGYTINWYENNNQTGAISNPNAYTTTGGTIYAQVVQDNGSCSGQASVNISVQAGPLVINGTYRLCDDGSGEAEFDLVSRESIVSPIVTDATITWYQDANLLFAVSNPSAFVSSGTTVYAKVDDGTCYTVAEIILEVNAFEVEDVVLSACDNGNGEGIFNLDQIVSSEFPSGASVNWFQDQNLLFPLSNADSYTTIATTIYAQVIAATCTTAVAVNLQVGNTVANDNSMSACDLGNGKGEFDLTTIESSVNGGTSNNVTWWEDALTSNNQITDPSSYMSGAKTIFARVSSGGDCDAIANITLSLSGSISVNDQSISITDNGNGQGTIDLTTLNSSISGSGTTITYYLDEDFSQAIADPSNFTTSAITIYANVVNGDGCEAMATIEISIEDNGSDNGGGTGGNGNGGDSGNGGNGSGNGSAYIVQACLGQDNAASFDLTAIEEEILAGQEGTIKWYLNLDFRNEITNPSLYESEEGIVYAKFEGTDDYVEVQLQFVELNISDASMQMCATDGGSAWFNLTALNDVVTNGENLDITWYEDEGLNNQIWTPTGYQSSGGTVYALIDDGDCYGVASISLTVGDILAYSSSMSLCADINGGATSFVLSSIDHEITGGTSFDVEWYTDASGANLITDATAYSISANETVYARVIASNLCSSDIVEVDLVIESTTAQEDTVLVCSAPFDVFDLTSVNDIVNNGTNNEVIWSTDANGSNIIANVDSFIPSGNAPYYVYASVCGDIVQIDLMGRNDEINLVLDYNEILLEGEDEIILGSNQVGLDHLWSPATGLDDAESEAPILEATTDLTYNLTVTDDIGCSDSKDFDVKVVNNKQDLVVTADIFSPNGDGKNDVIDLNLTGACAIDFRVFDRWGVEVYHSVSLDAYWDGRSLTGYNLSAGTYVIVVDVVYCGDDQSENYKKEIILMK